MNRWENQVAVITGSSAGIGAAISEELVECGLRVVGIARGKEKLEKLQTKLDGKKGKFYYFVGDIGKEEDVIKAFQWIKENVGVVHILINNAGSSKTSSLIEGNSEHIKSVINSNVFGLCMATREALKEMKDNNIDGHIIHINSVLGHKVVRNISFNVYPACKHAVTALTETLRNELSIIESKIKVSSISPGYVQTKSVEDSLKESRHANTTAESEKDLKDFLENSPFLYPKDISDAVVYVLSTPPNVQIHELIIKPVGEIY